MKSVKIKSAADGVWVSLKFLAQISRAFLPFRAQLCFATNHTLYCGMHAIHRAATKMSNNAQQILKNVFFFFQIIQLSNFIRSMNAINLKSTAGNLQCF